MIDLKHILFPTDFSEIADHARAYATEFGKRFGAKVTVFHVAQPPSYYEVAYSYETVADLSKIADQAKAAAEKDLHEVAEKVRAEGVTVDAVTTMGTAFVDIINYSRKHDVDLIIMSTHGRGFMQHVLLGSTAERVVRKAPCPVLTVRPAEHEFVHP